MPRAIVPSDAEEFDGLADASAHPSHVQVLLELAPDALRDQHETADDDHRADDAHEPPSAGVLHRLGRPQLLLAGLAAGAGIARDLERTDGEERVDDGPRERLHSRAGLPALAHHAECRLAQSPQGISGQADTDDPDEQRAAAVPRQFLQGATLVGLAASRAERQRDGQDADEQVVGGARRQAPAGKQRHDVAMGGSADRYRRTHRRSPRYGWVNTSLV